MHLLPILRIMLARQAVGKENRPTRKSARTKPYDRPPAKARPAPLKLVQELPKPAPAPVASKAEAKIPLRLPRPVIPPVQDLAQCDADLAGVPVDYIFARLRPNLPAYLVASTSYRPLPLPHPFSTASTSEPPRLSDIPTHVPFHLPPQASGSHAKFLKSDAPDVCLAISGAERGMLIPAHRIVYATQCAHYPGMSPPTPTSSTGSHYSPSPPLTPVTPVAKPETGTVMLPVRTLAVPSPESFPLLHTAMYHKSPTWLRKALLGPDLADLGNRELLACLHKIHGLWGNVCALGVADEDIWQGMGSAWAEVVALLRSRPGVKVHQTDSDV